MNKSVDFHICISVPSVPNYTHLKAMYIKSRKRWKAKLKLSQKSHKKFRNVSFKRENFFL